MEVEYKRKTQKIAENSIFATQRKKVLKNYVVRRQNLKDCLQCMVPVCLFFGACVNAKSYFCFIFFFHPFLNFID